MPRRRCYPKDVAKDMKLRHVFLSILFFGFVGLLFFMYLHARIEEQSPGLKIQQEQQITKFWNKPIKIPQKDWTVFKSGRDAGYRVDKISNETATERWQSVFNTAKDSMKQRLFQQRKMRNLLLKRFLEPMNLTSFRFPNWTLVTDAVHEERKRFLANSCKKLYISKRRRSLIRLVSQVYVEERHKLLYCEVPKAGCSNWKRILMVLSGLAKSPSNISHDFVHYSKRLRHLDSYSLRETYELLNSFTKVLFVRDPMERLVSAFRDKFEHSNSYYHPVFGKAILKKYRANASAEALRTGSGVTFSEFVQYLLDPHKPVGMDIHWEQISKLCSPCLINYDFIGKFESLEQDANYLLKLIGAPEGLQFPSFKDRHSSDERTTSAVVEQYLAQITPSERQQIYNFYYLDYLMFNYSKPHL
ncbi:carbohydrate sulfotransferase 9-like [Pristis pectinata]|uniref:carbohydrate sulfotransferase 9-like n=1 Tax=Pristis pectinata TaxID=685728 RepID=UPI00223CCFD2|nr:carbohydrate sulfotransferase 9-like [Pristis pectinata]XP_051879605.1 carbohydrate sulfotransferase 9-like [Pristis pectinata]XP_051879607.1 carbohydrate sulfotransferase 9-like [Pristis pectinata]